METRSVHATVDARGDVNDGIVTPDAVVLELETAGFSSRLLAGLIDLAVMAGIYLAVIIAVFLGFGGADDSTLQTMAIVLSVLLIFGYPIAFETWTRGRTPGKSALRLRAVTTEGAPITVRDATLRSMGGVVDKLLPPGGITGVLFVLFTPRHQRVGDLIAGTIVVRDPRQYVPAPALWFSPPYGLEAYAETIDPTAITVEQYTVVRSFLTRVSSLGPDARAALATDLADRLATRIHHRRDPYVAPEAFLLCVMARYQRRAGPATPAPVASTG